MERKQLARMRTGGPAQPRTLPPQESMMNTSTHVLRGPRRAWLPDVLIAAAIIALVLLAAVACSSGSGPPTAGSGGSPATGGPAASAVGYSHCMRSHGVPNNPTPQAGRFPRPTRSNSGSAPPSSRLPKDPASTCTRVTAGRSAPRSGNARKPATARSPWCARS
jgi:hypothetical protein